MNFGNPKVRNIPWNCLQVQQSYNITKREKPVEHRLSPLEERQGDKKFKEPEKKEKQTNKLTNTAHRSSLPVVVRDGCEEEKDPRLCTEG